MLFEEMRLARPLLKALNACHYQAPTPIQAKSIPPALEGRDLIASAQTGTGKTAAFVLPALQRLQKSRPVRIKGPRILVLTPTRELAEQICRVSDAYARYLPFKSVCIVGGMPYPAQLRALSQKPDLVVATPGRLIDHLERDRIDLSHVQVLVLDEADRMLDMGFIDDVEKISAAVPVNRQTLLFAATMGKAVVKLGRRLLNNPLRIEIKTEQTSNCQIEQRIYAIDDNRHKDRILQFLLGERGLTQAIIFSATRRGSDVLARDLKKLGLPAAALHGDMKQSARNRIVKDFRRGKVKLLVATDVAARGLDISGISHVFNYDLPRYAEDYVHRIGRTGRAGASGIAVSFVSRRELAYLNRIERYIGRPLPFASIPGLEAKRPLQSKPAPVRGQQHRNRQEKLRFKASRRSSGGADKNGRGSGPKSRNRKTASSY